MTKMKGIIKQKIEQMLLESGWSDGVHKVWVVTSEKGAEFKITMRKGFAENISFK